MSRTLSAAERRALVIDLGRELPDPCTLDRAHDAAYLAELDRERAQRVRALWSQAHGWQTGAAATARDAEAMREREQRAATWTPGWRREPQFHREARARVARVLSTLDPQEIATP